MIPSASFRLLTQDNTIPGNKKDGFRFHHLMFVIMVTPIYLWFELSFGVHLLDSISGVNSLENTIAIEHWGRLISGFAVALQVVISQLYIPLWDAFAYVLFQLFNAFIANPDYTILDQIRALEELGMDPAVNQAYVSCE